MKLRRDQQGNCVHSAASTNLEKFLPNFRPMHPTEPNRLPTCSPTKAKRLAVTKIGGTNPIQMRLQTIASKSMARCGLIGSTLAFAVAGCSSMPPFDAPISDRTGYPTVSQVVDKIECEVAAARDDATINSQWVKEHLAKKNPPLLPFEDWSAAVSVGLTVNSTEGAFPNSSGLTLAFIDPLKLAGNSFGFGANPVLYQSRQRIFALNYTIDIRDIDPSHCVNKKWHAFNLEGDLGLREQISAGLHSIVKGEADIFDTSKTGNTPDSFGGTVSFDIFKGVESGGPVFTLTRFKGPVGGLGVLREDKHSVVITFAPPKKPTGKETVASNKENAKITARAATADLVQRSQLSAINSSLNKM
jgi:hypothetical protein